MNGDDDRPSPAAIVDRSYSLVNELTFTVALQVRRLRSTEPEDEQFVSRWWADLQFLIVALRRLRRAAALLLLVDGASDQVRSAIEQFDAAVPGLALMRNVGEHLDAYAVDKPGRHHKRVGRRDLQVGRWDDTTFTWLTDASNTPLRLNIDLAKTAAEDLFIVVRDIRRNWPPR